MSQNPKEIDYFCALVYSDHLTLDYDTYDTLNCLHVG